MPSAVAALASTMSSTAWNFLRRVSSGMMMFEVWSVARLKVLLGAVQTM